MNGEDRLMNAINNNKNLPDLIKNHIMVFVGTLRETYPQFNYNEFERILSTINFEEGVTVGYATYDRPRNTLIVDVKDALQEGIDLQHMIFCCLLSICTGKDVE